MSSPASFAFQGTLGAFSHQAALALCDQLKVKGEMSPCSTFGEVFAQVLDGTATYGVIPLENSSIGSIVANYDLLWTNDAFIIGEYFLPVHHHLIGFAGAKVDDVRTVYSHPAALDQCRHLFKEHSQMVPRVHWDTSGAVAYVKDSGDKTSAAIAGELAAAEYGMAVLLQNVEDFAHNATRFGLITQASKADKCASLPPPYKLSIAMELGHQVGSLANLLNSLAGAGANLTKIESRPIGESPWQYRFFIDMELYRPEVEARVLSVAKEVSETYKMLGRYAATRVPDDRTQG
jgi:prephenate dehydratase